MTTTEDCEYNVLILTCFIYSCKICFIKITYIAGALLLFSLGGQLLSTGGKKFVKLTFL